MPLANLGEALAAVRSDDLLRVRPGPRAAVEPLKPSGPERLTIDARDAVLVGPYDGKTLAIDHVRDLRVVGWSLTGGAETILDDPGVAPVVSIEYSQGVTFEDISMACGGGQGLYLEHAEAFSWTRGLVTDASAVVSVDESTRARYADLQVARVKVLAAEGRELTPCPP